MALDQRVGEEAALVVVAPEPLVEEIEDGEEPTFRCRLALLHLPREPLVRPDLLAQLERCDRELVLRAEVPVESHLRNAGLGDDAVDADGRQPVSREQLVGGLQQALARLGVLSGAHVC